MHASFGIGVASRPLGGERQSGDLPVSIAFGGGSLLGAVDGLGHGQAAAFAASTAVECLARRPQAPLVELLRRCHEELRATRGVTMTVASFDRLTRTLTWAGVGNVEAALLHSDPDGRVRFSGPVRSGGVLGIDPPHVVATRTPLTAGDILIFATDGIATGFERSFQVLEPPQTIADRILNRYATGADDALVLVARYLPEPL